MNITNSNHAYSLLYNVRQRLDTLENDMSSLQNKTKIDIATHTHTTNDIKDYAPFDSAELEARIDDKANKTHNHDNQYAPLDHTHDGNMDTDPIWTNIVNFIYPVGSIYTSMTNTSPAELFKGTKWEPIHDRFLYCVDTSKNPDNGTSIVESKQTGGSKKIEVENLPAHSHTISNKGYNNVAYANDSQVVSRYTIKEDDEDTNRWTTNEAGGGKDYMPPYITVYAWHRTE